MLQYPRLGPYNQSPIVKRSRFHDTLILVDTSNLQAFGDARRVFFLLIDARKTVPTRHASSLVDLPTRMRFDT